MGRTLTYSDLDRYSYLFAAFLQQELGLSKGERIAIMLPNLLQYPIVLFGALRAGLTVVNTNPLYTPRELRHQLDDSGATAIVVLENFAHVLAQVLSSSSIEHVITTGVGDLLSFPKSWLVNTVVRHIKRLVPHYHIPNAIRFGHALQSGQSQTLDPPELVKEDIAFLQYTGGTTGVAKGAMLTHGNIVANLLQTTAWFKPALEEGKEIIIAPLPLYHIFSATASLVFMEIGAVTHLITNPRDLKGFVKELCDVKFSCIIGVNTLFIHLQNTPGFSALNFSHLKLTIGGGMAVQSAVAQHWQETTGCVLLEAYGLTEASPAVCINPIDLKAYNGAIGLPISSTECSIQDGRGKRLPIGEVGELCVRGPQVMKGYWKQPEETHMVLSTDGWLRTGDLATMDRDGFVRIVDRKKDVIIVSGFSVYPNEIEDVVATHPAVLEVGAIGVPDPDSGESVKIVVVAKDSQLTVDLLRDYCRHQLTGYKVPKHIEFRDQLPKSNVGKILRRELREQSATEAL